MAPVYAGLAGPVQDCGLHCRIGSCLRQEKVGKTPGIWVSEEGKEVSGPEGSGGGVG